MKLLRRILIATSCIILISSCGNKKSIIQPELKDISESVYASGIVKSKDQYQVFSKVNGILQTVFVKEGDLVKIGDTLFQLNSDNAHLVTENARLTAINSDYYANLSQLADLRNAIVLAREKSESDSMLYERQSNLWKSNIGTKVELEQSLLSFENSKTVLGNAFFKYNDMQRQLALASGQSKNNLLISKILENDLVIKSQVNGIVYSVLKEQNELVTSLSPIAVIGNDSQFLIELNIDEYDIVKVKIGQQVLIRMDSYKGQVFEAKISSIDPMMNEHTRTFRAETSFTKKPATLYPNLTLEANIVIQTKKDALTIPRNYILDDSLVTLEDGKIQKVETGLMDYDLVEITGGITNKTKIILPKQ